MELTYAYACNRCNRGNHVGGARRRSTRGEPGSAAPRGSSEGEPEVDHHPECPDHQPATFVKGKPRSIISLPTLLISPKVIRIDALRDRSCLETLATYYLSLTRNIYHESYLSPGTLIMFSYA